MAAGDKTEEVFSDDVPPLAPSLLAITLSR